MISKVLRRLRRAQDDDSGTALILALLVVLLVGAMFAAVLDFVGTGFTLASNTRYDRNQSNYDQGAVEGAINQIRGSSLSGQPGQPCPDFSPPNPAGLPGVGGSLVVTCTGVGGVPSGSDDQPQFAIQTLGSAGDGIRQVGGNNELTIAGGIYSAGNITVGGGSQNRMTVYGTAVARGSTCSTGLITTTDLQGVLCGYSGPASFGADPRYRSTVQTASALSDLIALGADPAPTCASPSSIVVFSQGYYSETPQDLATAAGCGGSVYWFQPGRYVLEYTGQWDLGPPKSIRLIGGTQGPGFGANPNLPTACDPTQPGVQLLFGGASRLATGGTGGLALCGPTPGQFPAAPLSGPERYVAVYGLSDNGVQAVSTPTATSTTLTAQAAPTTGGFLLPAQAQALDGTSATAALNGKADATLLYGSISDVPAGSRISSVTLRIGQTVTGRPKATVQVVTPSRPSNTAIALGDTCVPSCDVTIPLNQLGDTAEWRDLNAMQLLYKASENNGSGAATVDGIQVLVGYTPPALEAQSCTTGCTFFDSSTNPDVFVRGTVYSPTTSWSVNVHNNGETIFNRGVIMRDIAITMSASSKQTTAPFSLPSVAPNDRKVLFKAYLDGVLKVRACAHYTDSASYNGVPSAFPGSSVEVLKWNALRTPTDANSCS